MFFDIFCYPETQKDQLMKNYWNKKTLISVYSKEHSILYCTYFSNGANFENILKIAWNVKVWSRIFQEISQRRSLHQGTSSRTHSLVIKMSKSHEANETCKLLRNVEAVERNYSFSFHAPHRTPSCTLSILGTNYVVAP